MARRRRLAAPLILAAHTTNALLAGPPLNARATLASLRPVLRASPTADAPAALSVPRFRELLKMAQVIVLPVLPSAFDQAATRRFLKKIDDLKPIRSNKKPMVIVGNRVRARTRSAAELEAFIESLDHPMGAVITDRALYTDGAYSGVSVFDKTDKRSLDAQEDWSPLITFMETN